MHLATPDWLYHRLAVVGPADDLRAFSHTAQGPGFVPWILDYQHVEEDWFYRLMADQERRHSRHLLSAKAARKLAQQFRECVWQLYEGADPPPPRALDLHALRPLPFELLRLGPEHPDAIEWQWQAWGTTWPLRHVRRIEPPGHTGWACEFYSADWTPWRAIEVIQTRWPSLTVRLQLSY
jgi:hypothetical protein